MAATVKWVIKMYDLDGNPLDVDYSTYVADGETTNEVLFASNRSLSLILNGIDECSFTIALENPAAYEIRRLKTIIKIFRIVDDPDRGVSILGVNPIFCGIVQGTNKGGNADQMSVKCFSPLWRIQFKFHLLNHYLDINPVTSERYTISEMIWKLIALVQGAFGTASYLGIDQGTFEWGLPDEPQLVLFVAMGTKTWSLIFDQILQDPGSPDIFPVYMHADGDPTLMELNTMRKRGLDKSSTLKFNYHTDPDVLVSNLDDLTEEASAQPDQFANFLWVVGQGGANSNKYAVAKNDSAVEDSDGYAEIGVYMSYQDIEVKNLASLPPIAESRLKTMQHPQDAYTVTVSPSGLLYYEYDFVLGDVAALNADRGALQVSDKKQRIYQVTLNISDNNLETPELLIADDFYGKFDA